MFAKIIFVVFLATSVMSFPKDDQENELVQTALKTTSTLMKEALKVAVPEDAEKYSLDFPSLYKKYEIAAKAEQAKSFAQSQYKKVVEFTNDYVKKIDYESEDQLKKSIEIIKKEDAVLGEKLTKFYEKSCELDRISEDVIKYVLDADRVNGALDKAKNALRPIEHKMAESIKKFESVVLEHLPKKGKN